MCWMSLGRESREMRVPAIVGDCASIESKLNRFKSP